MRHYQDTRERAAGAGLGANADGPTFGKRGNRPCGFQASDYATPQDLVDKSFQIKESSQTSFWH